MTKRVQRRRGTSTQHDSFAGAMAEVTVDTSRGWLRVANGSTPGGYVVDGAANAEWSGARGDNSADDLPEIQATIDAASTFGIARVRLRPGATYRCVINDTVDDLGLVIRDGVTLCLDGAALALECTGEVYGTRLSSNSHIEGPGDVNVTVSSLTTSNQAIFHAPISLGDAYSLGGSIASPSPFQTASNWSVRRLVVSSVRTQAYGSLIHGFGGMHGGVIEDIVIPDNDNTMIGIGFDWNWVGAEWSTADADIQDSRDAFDNGDFYTTHPHDITIRNIHMGELTYIGPDGATPGAEDRAYALRWSGCYNMTAENIHVAKVTGRGFMHTAGDAGFEFAPASVKPYRLRNNVVRDFFLAYADDAYGAFVDTWADNIGRAELNEAYTPLLDPIYEADVLIENFHTWSDSASTVIAGFRAQTCNGVTFRDCTASGHLYGGYADDRATRVKFEGGSYTLNRAHGVYIHHGTGLPSRCSVNVRAHSNGTADAFSAGVYLGTSDRCAARDCDLGMVSDPTQYFGVRASDGAVHPTVADNHTRGLAASGVAYFLGSGGSAPLTWEFRGNTCEAGTSFLGGAEIVPFMRQITASGTIITYATAPKAILTGGITPAVGTWTAGSTIDFVDPVASGHKGTACETPGSPGAWKLYGPLTA